MSTDGSLWSYLNMTRGWRLEGERGTFTLHDLPVPDHLTVHDIMIRRGGRARVPLADWTAGRGWRMGDIKLTEAEAMAIANGADPLRLLAGPRIRLEIVRTGN